MNYLISAILVLDLLRFKFVSIASFVEIKCVSPLLDLLWPLKSFMSSTFNVT